MRKFLSWFAVPAILLLPLSAYAHTGLGTGFGLMAGAGHPVSGLDHMLAMVAVGIWAVQGGGRSVWLVPTSFVSVMLLGGLLAYSGVALPYVEQGIMLSVVFLGLLIFTAVTFRPTLSATLVGVFALFHGYAHGAELPHLAMALSYSVGFVVTTALLHIAGIVVGRSLQSRHVDRAFRFIGGAIALSGVVMLAA